MKHVTHQTASITVTFASLAAITLVIYWPGLHGPLLLDDGPQLKPILYGISSSSNWAEQYKEYILSTSGILKRPVSMGSFILNAILSGNDIWYWKLTNVLLHSLTGIVIYLLTRLLFSLNKSKDVFSFNSDIASLCVAAIWLFHPLQVSTVLYLVQRMTILSALFTMCALLLYAHGFINEIKKKSGIIQLLTSIVVFFPLSLLSKENAAALPFYILIISSYIIHINNISIANIPTPVKIYNTAICLLMVVGIFILFLYRDELVLNGYKLHTFSLYERLLTEPRVIMMYLTQIIIPIPSLMGFFHDDFIISHNISHPFSTFSSILFIIVAVISSILFRNKSPIILFGLIFYLASHFLESTIFPLEIAFEHRNYVGIWGIILLLFSCMSKIIQHRLYLMIPICCFLISMTYYRSSIWSNPGSMYKYMISIHPDSPRLNIIFAEANTASGKYHEALLYLNKNDSLGADLHRLNIQCLQTGKLINGSFARLIQAKANLSIHHYALDGIITLANYGLDNKCQFSKIEFVDFLDFIGTSNSLHNSKAQKIMLYQAHYYHDQKNISNAIKTLQRSFSKDTSNPIPLFLMTEWLIEGNRADEAMITFTKAKQIATDSFYDYSDLIYRIERMIDQAYLH